MDIFVYAFLCSCKFLLGKKQEIELLCTESLWLIYTLIFPVWCLCQSALSLVFPAFHHTHTPICYLITSLSGEKGHSVSWIAGEVQLYAFATPLISVWLNLSISSSLWGCIFHLWVLGFLFLFEFWIPVFSFTPCCICISQSPFEFYGLEQGCPTCCPRATCSPGWLWMRPNTKHQFT